MKKKLYINKCEKCKILLSKECPFLLCPKCRENKEIKKTSYDKLCEDLRARGVMI